MDIDDLTPVAQDYLKVIWSATEWGDPPITTTALAERFATSRAAVSETMRRLATQGLVDYEPYRPVALTPLGEGLALAMVRRHRLIETFLAEIVGYGWDEVHDDAERLEHAASPLFLERIDDLLGHPTTDPHGDPIPPGEGTIRPETTIGLADAAPGTYEVCRVADTNPRQLRRLRDLSVLPGHVLSVAGAPPAYRRPASGEAIPLEPDDVIRIRVRPHSAP